MIQHQTSAKPALSNLVMASSSQFYATEPDADSYRASVKRKQSDSDAETEKSDKLGLSSLDSSDYSKNEPVFYKSTASAYDSSALMCHSAMPAAYPWMKEPRLVNAYGADLSSPSAGLKIPVGNGYSNMANLSSGSVSSSSPNDSINTPTTAKTSKSFL